MAAKLFAEACQSGDVVQFSKAAAVLHDLPDGWTFAFRQVARLGLAAVPQPLQDEFQLLWFEAKMLAARCDDKHALLDALRVLFTPYRGPAVRLFRGAAAYEGRARKFYGPSWSTDIEEADLFARHYQTASGGSVVLGTLASPDAIISAPCLTGPSWESTDGSPLYDEREHIVDGRHLRVVTITRRYPQISLEERYPQLARPASYFHPDPELPKHG